MHAARIWFGERLCNLCLMLDKRGCIVSLLLPGVIAPAPVI